MSNLITLIAVIVGGCLALIGSLIVLNLRSIKSGLNAFTQRVDKQENKIEKTQDEVKLLNQNMSLCKIDCDRNTVSKEDWVRSEGYTRKELKELTSTLSRIEGKFGVVEKIPEICGGIVREVVTQLNNGGHNGG